jgi:AcrR family transcriptional regulator
MNVTIGDVSPRSYRQSVRAEAAAATRMRIIDATIARIRAEPSRPPSVDEIANLAQVARSTVYTVFGSRPGLFDAVALELHDRGGYARLLEAVREPDPRKNMRGGITAGVEVFASDPDVFRALHSMEKLDPNAVGGAIARIEAQRAQGMAWLARRLKKAGELRKGVTVERAAHVVWIAASFDAFDLLHSGRSLGSTEIAEILVDQAERTICRDA